MKSFIPSPHRIKHFKNSKKRMKNEFMMKFHRTAFPGIKFSLTRLEACEEVREVRLQKWMEGTSVCIFVVLEDFGHYFLRVLSITAKIRFQFWDRMTEKEIAKSVENWRRRRNVHLKCFCCAAKHMQTINISPCTHTKGRKHR